MSSGANILVELAQALRQARSLAVLTGAGISAESGLPTFREAQTGLWAQYRPEELASPAAFQRNPGLVWEWYAWRRRLVAQAQPNPGHLALAQLERRVPRFTLLTQNVDGLHERAGSTGVIHLHGTLMRSRCSAEGTPIEEQQDAAETPPRCPRCGALARPDVVWFGESLPHAALETALAVARDCDVFLAVGTSGLVQPAASLPYLALEMGATLGVFNLEPTIPPLERVYPVYGPAAATLPALLAAAWPEPQAGGEGEV